MRLTKPTVTVLVGLALVMALPSLAQKAGQEACEKACGILNLTPEQAAKIENLKIEHQKALLLLQTDLKTKRLELRQLMNEKADQKTLEAKIDELAKVGANIQKKCLAHRNEVRGLLTDEQKKSFDQKCGGMGCGAGMDHGARCGSRTGHGDHRMGKMGGCGHGPKGVESAKCCSGRCK
jgi:Spy/CpxP family protein refolding chaperone